jgi:hypothetical protein
MPIMMSEAFFAYRARMMMLEPNLKASKTEEVAALCQCAHIEAALTNHAQPFQVNFAFPGL